MIIIDAHIEAAEAMEPAAKLAFLEAVIAYTREGVEPDALPPEARPAWVIAKKDIDNMREESKRKAEAGRRGGIAKARNSKHGDGESVAEPGSAIAVPDSATEKIVAETWQEPSRTCLKEKEKEKEKEKGVCDTRDDAQAHAVYFDPPSPAEVEAYAKANAMPPFDAQAFCDHYGAQGWVMGNGKPMMDWKAAARKWSAGQWRFRADDEKKKEAQNADYDRFIR